MKPVDIKHIVIQYQDGTVVILEDIGEIIPKKLKYKLIREYVTL